MTVLSRTPLLAWSPRELVARIGEQTLDGFCAEFFNKYFLVVRLDDFSSELAGGLGASRVGTRSMPPPRRNTLSFSLATNEQTQVTGPSLTSLRPPPARPSMPASGEFSCAPDLLRASCHVVEIKKRAPSAPVGVVSVGRSPEHDIVLQHPSVSRTHAHFECSGDLFVMDMGSSNHTFVNGERVIDRVAVAAGDAIKFGAVRCSVCSPAGLWHAIRG